MTKFPFQLSIKCIYPNKQTDSLSCTALLRAIPNRRHVYDALWNDRNVIVKVFLHYISAKRHLRREWRGLSELKERGLSSPAPLFFGRTENGNWALVIEKIVDSSTALDVFNRTEEKDNRLDLLVLVCKELVKQHDKGVVQKDLHLGNFLWQKGKLYTLDTAQISLFSSEIGRKKSISQLALLACILPDSDTESISRLFKEYFKARRWDSGNSDRALFQKQLIAQRKRTIKHGLKKCLRTNKRHLRIEVRSQKSEIRNLASGLCPLSSVAVFDRGFCLGIEPIDFIQQLDTLMNKGNILKQGNTSFVSHLIWNDKDIVVKRYNHKGLIHSLRHTLKWSRAKRGWLNGHRLLMLNMATPKPLAFIEQYKGLLLWNSYLITEYVNGPMLYNFRRDGNVTEKENATVNQQVLEMLDNLGKYKISHGDLKHSNILVTNKGPMIPDLDGMKVHKSSLMYKVRKAKDMANFANR